MIYMWFTGINYYKLAVEKDRDSIFTTIWKPGFNVDGHILNTSLAAILHLNEYSKHSVHKSSHASANT
jgi:hypothetical protein